MKTKLQERRYPTDKKIIRKEQDKRDIDRQGDKDRQNGLRKRKCDQENERERTREGSRMNGKKNRVRDEVN